MAKQAEQSATAQATPSEGSALYPGQESGNARPATLWGWIAGHKLVVGAAAVVFLLLCVGIGLSLTGDSGPPSAQRFAEALLKLDDGKNSQARKLAQVLEEQDYHDPNFAGGAEFILGMVAFREAAGLDEEGQEQSYILAATYLREAHRRGLTDERLPEWAFASGVSLHRTGRASEARPLLEQAVASYPPGRVEASLLLGETYLYLKDLPLLEQALKLNAAVAETPGIATADLDRAYLQRAQILLALGRNTDAEQMLARVSDGTNANHGTIVLRSQTYIAEGKYELAQQMLEPIAKYVGLERTYPRQASYLLGVCAQRLGDRAAAAGDQAAATNFHDAAVSQFERTAHTYENSHEALASNLWAGDVLREMGRNEEALEAYGQALRMVRRPENFRNVWLDLEKFRQAILHAWNDWVEKHLFAEAITLSELMTPLFPRDQSHEMAARANQRWAEYLESVLESLPYSQRARQRAELERRWNQSGQAYARLAQDRTATAEYPDTLWISAAHYMNGHDYSDAAVELTRFIATHPTKLLPAALVRRGQAYMHLSQFDKALQDLQQVVDEFPTDLTAFDARYLVGQCYLERQELDAAERTWRAILNARELTPRAREWRQSLFALGKLLYTRCEIERSRAVASDAQGAAPPSDQSESDRLGRWKEALTDLEQFIDRYPNAPEVREARYLLAKAWQRSAEIFEQSLKRAETENARNEFRRQKAERLQFAITEFNQLQAELRNELESDRLDELGQTLLRNCTFEAAHTHYALGHYNEAIIAYSNAVTRYQLEAETLTAYVQMANCYDRMGKRAEARSMLEQAKVIVNQIPDAAFQSPATNMTREEWRNWLNWAMGLNS